MSQTVVERTALENGILDVCQQGIVSKELILGRKHLIDKMPQVAQVNILKAL